MYLLVKEGSREERKKERRYSLVLVNKETIEGEREYHIRLVEIQD